MNDKATNIVVQSLVSDINKLTTRMNKLEAIVMSIAVAIRESVKDSKEVDGQSDNNPTS